MSRTADDYGKKSDGDGSWGKGWRVAVRSECSTYAIVTVYPVWAFYAK